MNVNRFLYLLGGKVAADGCSCDESKPLCREVFGAMQVPADVQDTLLDRFEAHGGYCDCEVIANVSLPLRYGLRTFLVA